MDINLYIEGLRQSQEKTSRQKDILDTWEEIQADSDKTGQEK